MVRNYIKIAFRNLWKHKSFSAINIAGLAAGLTACFFILSYVRFELSYDNFHSKADRIVRLRDDVITPTETIPNGISVYPAGPAITADFPEVESMVRVSQQEMIFIQGDRKFRETNILLSDSTFFRIFDFKLVEGHAGSVLAAPGSVVITEAMAAKYFGEAPAMGKTIQIPQDDRTLSLTVTGIMAPMPENSQLRGDAVVSLSTAREAYAGFLDNWTNHAPYTYLLLKPGTDYKALEAKFPAFLEKHIGKTMDDFQMHYTYHITPIKDIYLSWGALRYAGITGSIGNVRIFTIV
ncbi:ABC transporter permease, partial [uncultured Chitinophaga sp.]|uniref:ABC transporter permease n=2 Tax=Chitinophaga TaxID=79328 RepID=UPI002633B1CF